MNILVDSQLLIWAIIWPHLMPKLASEVVGDRRNRRFHSVASLWEIAIKASQNKPGFDAIDVADLRDVLLASCYCELPILSDHAIASADPPYIHKDPLDRLLVAQASIEGLTLLTTDKTLMLYPGAVKLV